MKHAGPTFLVVMLFATLGLWGYAQQKNGSYALQLRELAGRSAKLEEEQRNLTNVSERNQRRIVQLETERADLLAKVDQLQSAVVERDTLRTQVADLSTQRDRLRTRSEETARMAEDLRGQLAQTSADRDALQVRLANRTAERDDLSKQLTLRVRERDTLGRDLQGLRRELQSMMLRIDASLANVTLPPTTDATPVSRPSE